MVTICLIHADHLKCVLELAHLLAAALSYIISGLSLQQFCGNCLAFSEQSNNSVFVSPLCWRTRGSNMLCVHKVDVHLSFQSPL